MLTDIVKPSDPSELTSTVRTTNTQLRAPLFEALQEYVAKDAASFHTPGHKHGRGMPKEFVDFIGRNVCAIDLTEFPELDNPYQPSNLMKEAEALAAQAFGADYTFFLANGSTCGNQVAVLAVCNPGDAIIVPRNIHRSALSGIILAGAVPIYVEPTWDKDFGIFHGVTVEGVAQALHRYPEAKAVFLVSPNYHGGTVDLKNLARLTHAHGKTLLVDEAHGPHLQFHTELPTSALEAGADLVVQSTHKTLSSLSQASMLHICSDRLSLERVRSALFILRSTSPNYALMASLDIARRQMALHGTHLLERALELAEYARHHLNEVPGIRCLERDLCGMPGLHDLDITKLTINTRGLGYSGFAAASFISSKFYIQVDMATLYNLLAIMSFGTTKSDIDRLIHALRELSDAVKTPQSLDRLDLVAQTRPPIPDVVMAPREAFLTTTEAISFEKSHGRICAEIVALYPPGIPILAPGERIAKEHIEFLKVAIEYGARVSGADDSRLKTIRVVE